VVADLRGVRQPSTLLQHEGTKVTKYTKEN
jgi:hypothetical protein